MKHGNKQGNDLKRACMGSLLCLLATLLLALLFGKLVDAGLVRMELVPAAACGIAGLSALAGCIVTALGAKQGALLWALVTGALYYVLLLCAHWLLTEGEPRAMLPTLLCVLAAALVGSLLGAGKRSRGLR